MLSTVSMSVLAGGGKITSDRLPTAEIFGDIDVASTARTTVIVEIHEESLVEAKHKGKNQTKANLASKRGEVISSLENQVNDVEVNREYDYLFSGFSVELKANEITKLLAIPGVKAVYPNVTYTVDAVGGDLITPELFSPHMMDSAPFIGANDAWDAGFTGEGITVAVIDTGADYTHPDLKHAFGDYKGWDFVDNDNDPQETPPGDPRGGSTAHGTHVSGTVAANGVIKGVAPDATLLAYRVLGPGGSGTTENVVAGIERAVQDGADVMNLSLGNTTNDPDWATSLALDWAMAEGVVAVTSNGNSGPDNWTVGSPGTSRDAISVGANQLPYNVFSVDISTDGDFEYPTATVMGHPGEDELLALNEGEFEFVDVGLGAVADFEGKDLEGKIALISRGGFAFVDKATNAKNAGAAGAIIYNNADEEFSFIIPGMDVATIKLSGIDGQKMLEELEDGNNMVSFDIEIDSAVGETVADFSSRGPVMNTWMIKPDVGAPGVNITSTVPTHNPENPHGYAAYQGTSMSAPHVAGAAALILEAHPDWEVDHVKSALMNTAVDVIDPATGESYPHNTQGAGSVRVLDAIETKTLVIPGSHSYGVFSKEKVQTKRQNFTIKDLTRTKRDYTFKPSFEGNPEGIKVSFETREARGNSPVTNVSVLVEVDTSKLDPGYYEGSIQVSDGTQTINVPTILFVGEPDYPRDLLTGVYFGNAGDGTYDVGSDIPFGADVLEYDLLHFTNGGIGALIGTFGSFTDVPGPFHDFTWDGQIGGEDIPNGQYVLAVYVEKDGQAVYDAYLITKD